MASWLRRLADPRRDARKQWKAERRLMEEQLQVLGVIHRTTESGLARIDEALAARPEPAMAPIAPPIPAEPPTPAAPPSGTELASIDARLAALEARLVDYGDGQPLDLARILWNADVEPYASHEQRWAWIERANRAFFSRRRTLPIGEGTLLTFILGRYWMALPEGYGVLAARLLTWGSWELFQTEAIFHAAKPGTAAIDVGANVGYFTLLMADRVGSTGRVYAFEPGAHWHPYIRRTLELNFIEEPRVELSDRAAFSRSGEQLRLALLTGDNRTGHLVGDGGPREAGTIVPTTSVALDDAVPPGTAVSLVKIDVDGAELEVLRGMARIVEDNPGIVVLCEANAGHDYPFDGLLDLCEAYGFALAHLDPFRGPQPMTREELMTQNVGADWILYLKRPA